MFLHGRLNWVDADASDYSCSMDTLFLYCVSHVVRLADEDALDWNMLCVICLITIRLFSFPTVVLEYREQGCRCEWTGGAAGANGAGQTHDSCSKTANGHDACYTHGRSVS